MDEMPQKRCAFSDFAFHDKRGGMGLSRIVEIDTTGGPGFGFEHFKQYDFHGGGAQCADR
jgi:hypothetical protein